MGLTPSGRRLGLDCHPHIEPVSRDPAVQVSCRTTSSNAPKLPRLQGWVLPEEGPDLPQIGGHKQECHEDTSGRHPPDTTPFGVVQCFPTPVLHEAIEPVGAENPIQVVSAAPMPCGQPPIGEAVIPRPRLKIARSFSPRVVHRPWRVKTPAGIGRSVVMRPPTQGSRKR